jgi:hypothetical protein
MRPFVRVKSNFKADLLPSLTVGVLLRHMRNRARQQAEHVRSARASGHSLADRDGPDREHMTAGAKVNRVF